MYINYVFSEVNWYVRKTFKRRRGINFLQLEYRCSFLYASEDTCRMQSTASVQLRANLQQCTAVYRIRAAGQGLHDAQKKSDKRVAVGSNGWWEHGEGGMGEGQSGEGRSVVWCQIGQTILHRTEQQNHMYVGCICCSEYQKKMKKPSKKEEHAHVATWPQHAHNMACATSPR